LSRGLVLLRRAPKRADMTIAVAFIIAAALLYLADEWD
jgi:hypothetical protein